MELLDRYELWFVTGSQHLYGNDVLARVEVQAREVAAGLDDSSTIPTRVVFKPVLTTPAEIHRLCLEANAQESCVGLVAWMHTFSPAKMWIAGLGALHKPLLHLHTQFNAALPWAEIDMEFMNLNQSAHGDREFGHLATRIGLRRKTVAGHWRDPGALDRVGTWARAACGWHEAGRLVVARFGDTMRQVAVTDGDRVEAQIQLGFSVHGYGTGDLVEAVAAVSDAEADELAALYESSYEVTPELRRGGARHASLVEAARIEVGLRTFLDRGGYRAFTDTFEDLHGLEQLPGIAAQRLMADGYGFGAEGDWKASALVRMLKVMATGLPGGTSFMEDYTYDFSSGGAAVLGSHMLEICPSIAAGRPSCEIHPLSIGGKRDPVRLVFTAAPGPAVVVSLVDLGDRFRLIANEVDVVEPPEPLPRLPVARAVWRPRPSLEVAAEAWLEAGGSHHTACTSALGIEAISDLAEIAGIELVVIDTDTRLRELRNELRWSSAYYRSQH